MIRRVLKNPSSSVIVTDLVSISPGGLTLSSGDESCIESRSGPVQNWIRSGEHLLEAAEERMERPTGPDNIMETSRLSHS